MFQNNKILLGKSNNEVYLLPNMANRHGLICGASGTGKTVTLKVLAEGFSDCGAPVFLVDIKGDLSGMCEKGINSSALEERIAKLELSAFDFKGYPTHFWDVYGKAGHTLRATVSDMGPLLISELLELSEIQAQIMNVIFKIADDNELLLIDVKDLKAMIKFVLENRKELSSEYGNLSSQSLSAIQRSLISLESIGGDIFFGEPMLDIFDLLSQSSNGLGYINILDGTRLSQNKALYSAFMLWLLSEFYEKMPEVGDLDRPKAVLFFDEAHLIFNKAPNVLIEKIEQVIKLIRSKGVGIYFISQSPSDIPDTVLAQLSNKVQHGLRAYTPKEQKSVKAAAQAFRPNNTFKTEDVICELETGEALVSFLDEKGAPSIVERAFILPPQSKMGTIDISIRNSIISESDLEDKYGEAVDNISAYEVLEDAENSRNENEARLKEEEKLKKEEKRQTQKISDRILGTTMGATGRSIGRAAAKAVTGKSSGIGGSIASALLGSIGREFGKSISRGIFGSRK